MRRGVYAVDKLCGQSGPVRGWGNMRWETVSNTMYKVMREKTPKVFFVWNKESWTKSKWAVMGGGAHAAREIQRRGSRNIASAERKFIILFVVRTGYGKQKGLHKGCGGRAKEIKNCSEDEQGLWTLSGWMAVADLERKVMPRHNLELRIDRDRILCLRSLLPALTEIQWV